MEEQEGGGEEAQLWGEAFVGAENLSQLQEANSGSHISVSGDGSTWVIDDCVSYL